MGVVAVAAFAFLIVSLSVRVVVFLPINSLLKKKKKFRKAGSRQRSMYKPFELHPFIQRLRAHPGFSSADRELIAEAEAHPAYCLVSRACLRRWEAMLRYRHASQAPAQQWNVYGSGIGLRQRRALLCRGALCAVLVSRLMHFQGRHVAMNFNALHHACCVISRRHFLVALAPGQWPRRPQRSRLFAHLWQLGFIQRAVQAHARVLWHGTTRATLLSPTLTIIACKLFD
jgi:hypothetical protein